jgi:hypothetical protein
MAEPKTKPTDASVSAFLGAVADPARRAECQAVAMMLEEVTGEQPTMWGPSIVGFGRYRYRGANGKDAEWPVIGFSPRKTDLTLYLMPGVARFDALTAKLGRHKVGKSCLYVRKLADVDVNVLRQLCAAAVKAMEPKRVR